MSQKVAYFVGTLQTGGIERSVTDWCLYLKKHTSWEPIVICLIKKSGPFKAVLENNKVPVYECKLNKFGFVLSLQRLLRELRPDVVHSQVSFSMPWQVMGIRWAGVRKIVFTQQNEYQNWNPLMAKLRIRTYFYLFFRFIKSYTCVSERVRKSLSALAKVPLKKLIVIPNGVNTDVFRPDHSVRQTQRQLLGIGPDTFLVGMVARFSPQKGHHFLVEGIKELKRLRNDFRVILIGQGPLLYPVKEQVRQSGFEDCFIFSGRSLDVESILQALDCFILPSLWEGMPLALLEAMACGVPVVGTEVAGIVEVIQNGENGLLIPSKDPAAIAAALDRLASHPALRKELSEQALLTVQTRYSVSSCTKEYIRLYES